MPPADRILKANLPRSYGRSYAWGSRHRTLSGAPCLPLDSPERPPSDPDDAPEPVFESSGVERPAPPDELLLPRFPPADRGREESVPWWGEEVVVLLRAMFPRKLPSAHL